MLRIIPAILQLHQRWFTFFLCKKICYSNGNFAELFSRLNLRKFESVYVQQSFVLLFRSIGNNLVIPNMPPKKRAAATKQKEVENEVEPQNDVAATKSKKEKIVNGDDGGAIAKKATKRPVKNAKVGEPVETSEDEPVAKVTVQRGKRNVKENPVVNIENEVKTTKKPTAASKKTTKGNTEKTSKKTEKVVEAPAEEESDENEEPIPKKRGAKKAKEESKDLENGDQNNKPSRKRGKTPVELENTDETAEQPLAKQKRVRKVKEAVKEDDDTVAEPPKKAARKKETTKKVETKKSKPKKTKDEDAASTSGAGATDDKKNQTTTDWDAIDFSSKKKNAKDEAANLKITSWNVDGMRAWLKKDGMNILKYDSPDIFCLQETKCSDEDLPDEVKEVKGYETYWCSSNKKGYAGVGIFTKKKPIEVLYGIGNEEQDEDGRCVTAEFDDFYLVNVYVPNAGRKLVTLDKRLDWNEKFKNFIKELDEKKPIIVCGDMNVAHNEIDLKNPKSNTKNAGFTKEEREGMTDFLESGFADTFRSLYPEKEDVFTFWTYMMNARKKNIGWRLDYFLVSNRIKEKVCDNVVLDKVFGSDHCPIKLFINI